MRREQEQTIEWTRYNKKNKAIVIENRFSFMDLWWCLMRSQMRVVKECYIFSCLIGHTQCSFSAIEVESKIEEKNANNFTKIPFWSCKQIYKNNSVFRSFELNLLTITNLMIYICIIYYIWLNNISN